MTLTISDLFAGAGGSSTGATWVPGVQLVAAANHWIRAIETHTANHPDAEHVLADISQYDPRLFPRSDLLWASPECTNHSKAKGVARRDREPDLFGEILPSEAAERSRATMWDVVRFAERHRYLGIVVENVVEVTQWECWHAWTMALESLGYSWEVVSLNAMHSQARGLPAPQSRDRVYVVCWRTRGRRPDLERVTSPQAWCRRCDDQTTARQAWKPSRTIGRYRQQYRYNCGRCGLEVEPAWLPASSIIDWTLPAERIGDRTKPLADKTRRRIAAGIARYWQPLQVETMNGYDAADPKHPQYGDPNAYHRSWPLDEALRTLHTSESKALAIPVEGRADMDRAVDLTRPLRTVTTRNETGIALQPFVAELRGGGSTARSTADPLATITAGGNHHGLVAPYYGNTETAKPTVDPIGTLTTVERYGLVTADDVERAAARVDDCRFRMLEPSEYKRGMAFPAEYQMLGNRREQVRLAGNAVVPPTARDLIWALSDSLQAVAA